MAERAEIWIELDGDRDRHALLHRAQNVDVTLLDLASREGEIHRDPIDVEFDRAGAGFLDEAGIIDPAAVCDAIETRHNRNVDGFDSTADNLKIVLRSALILDLCREVGERLRET